jgi:curved DNA-binding protein CbpA
MANYYELLGVPKTATTAEVRKAYALLAREKHPDRFPDPAAKAAAQQSFQEITAAFNTLSNDRTRREYDLSLAAPPRPPVPEEIARDAFLRGTQLHEAKKYFEAVELFRIAVANVAQEARYHAALGRALVRNPHWVREGIQSLERAVQLAPKQAAYHAELAELLAGQGLRIRARKAAEAALRIDPAQPVALRVLEATVEDAPPPPAAGGLKGLLRRKP